MIDSFLAGSVFTSPGLVDPGAYRPTILTGPTAVGKTAVALALAESLPVRIISADSMQVYRGLDIGTAKPTAEEQQRTAHYGIDLSDPDAPYSVAHWVSAVAPQVEETIRSGDLPLIVGGTRLYLQSLAGSFRPTAPPDPELRMRLTSEAAEIGVEALHARMTKIDPSAGARIHPHDLKRIMRALEVHDHTGSTITEEQLRSQEEGPRFPALKIALVRDRSELYAMVEQRTKAMLREGWIEEVQRLIEAGFGQGLEEIKAHGYRELALHLQGRASLEDALVRINLNVRHYVRYQLGWIRQMSDVVMIEASQPAQQIAEVVRGLILQQTEGS